MFHFASHPEARRPPTRDPPARIGAGEQPGHRQQHQAQATKSSRVVVSSCIAPRYSRAARGRERGQQLAAAPGPERPRHRGGQQHQRRQPERGQRPQADQRVRRSAARRAGRAAGSATAGPRSPQRDGRPAARKYSSSRTYPYRALNAISTPKAAAAASHTALCLITRLTRPSVPRSRRSRDRLVMIASMRPASAAAGRSASAGRMNRGLPLAADGSAAVRGLTIGW